MTITEPRKTIVTFAYQADTGVPPASLRVPYTIASIRKNMPGATIVQLTNETFPAAPGVDEALRYPFEGDFIEWAYGALLKLFEREQDVLQIATDILIMKDVRDVFVKHEKMQIGACRYPYQDRKDGAYCGDVNFVRAGYGGIFAEALKIYKTYAHKDGWEGGQYSFLDASKLQWMNVPTYPVEALDYDTYCRTPQKPDENMEDAAIIHFRGWRKNWMIAYAVSKGILPELYNGDSGEEIPLNKAG